MPGFAFFREQDLGAKSVPQMLRMRAMSAMQVIALPPRPIWSRQVSSTGATAQDIRERMAMDPWAGKDVGGEQTVSMRKPRVSAEDRDDQILSELSQDPCRSISSLATATGASKSVVKKRLGQMEADGLVWMDSDGCWHVVTD
jgi:S-DNA-T family DNA segregation ATPase FtsK/SpoIIIE